MPDNIMRLSDQSQHAKNMWHRAVRVRFFWLLVVIVGVILAAPALPGSIGGEWEGIGLAVGVVSAASYVTRGLHQLWILGFFALILIAAAGLDILFRDTLPFRTVLFSTLLLILAYTSINILSFVLDEGKVGAEHIYGAVCAYVLIAMAFATLDFLLENLAPGSFSDVHVKELTDRGWWQFFYFSFTTLSTVGYGDIVPLTMRARSFVVIEQLVAVFYVAILIARLTGMYSADAKPANDQQSR